MSTKVKRKMNKKLMLSVIMLIVVSIASVAGIVTVLALSSRTIDSAMFVRFMAVDIDGEVEAAYKIGDGGSWTSMSGATPHVFDAADEEGSTQMNPGDIKLTSTNNYVEFRYVFRNFGDVDYTGLLTLDEVSQDSNMQIQYKYNDAEYSTSSYGLVVEGVDTASADKIKTRGTEKYTEMVYYIKVGVKELNKSGSYSSDFFWLLEKYEAVAGEQVIKLATSNYTANGDGTYSAAYNGADISIAGTSSASTQAVNVSNVWYVPSRLGSAAVTKVLKGEDLPANTKVVLSNTVKEIETGMFKQNTSLVDIYLGNALTSISANEFEKCTNLQNVTIGSNLTSIGNYAFDGCSSLKSVNVENNSKLTTIGEYAFRNCKVMTSCEMPESITTIGKYAFYYCQGLTTFNFGEDVTIGTYGFAYCSKLAEVTLAGKMTTTESAVFYNCTKLLKFNVLDINKYAGSSFAYTNSTPLYYAKDIYYNGGILTNLTIGNSVEAIGMASFATCKSLSSINLPSSLKEVGSSAFRECPNLITVNIEEGVTTFKGAVFRGSTSLISVDLPASLTTIGNNTFYGCSSLQSATIPSSLTTIGTHTFYNCSALSNVIIENGVTTLPNNTFQNCTGLTRVNLPSSLTTTGNYVFSGCTGLTSVTIPSTLTTTGNNVFSGCTGLTSVTIPSTLTTMGTYSFSGCTGLTSITIENGVKTLPSYTFQNCTSLTNVNLPSSVTTMGSYVFSGCTGLTSATITTRITSMGSYCFSKCSGLTSVTIQQGVTKIADRTFEDCTSLTSIVIPEGVTYIGTGAFNRCAAMQSISIPSTVSSMGSYAFDSCAVNAASITVASGNTVYKAIGNCLMEIATNKILWAGKNCVIPTDGSVTEIGQYAFQDSDITSIVIPSSVTKIGNGAFYDCKNLNEIVYEERTSLISMGTNVFKGCISLKHLVLPEGCTQISSEEFSGNTTLVSITLPTTIKTIGASAFSGCSALTDVIFVENNTQFTSIGWGAFQNCTRLKNINIPSSIQVISDHNSLGSKCGQGAFDGCSSLQFNVYDNCSYLGNSTNPYLILFKCNSSTITSVTVHDSTKMIYNSAFKNKTKLQTITIGSNVQFIRYSVFVGCSGLTNVIFKDTDVWYKDKSTVWDVTDSAANAAYLKSLHKWWSFSKDTTSYCGDCGLGNSTHNY